ncbi:dUTP diphosphatase [Tardiphaga sp. 862_B3_N1_1]|uniref:dUTP diphosphatase n=1 Tax=Tardiphaga sp. 862_B3_N1_1 TaxID=3240763 RepID=UPI003F8B167F
MQQTPAPDDDYPSLELCTKFSEAVRGAFDINWSLLTREQRKQILHGFKPVLPTQQLRVKRLTPDAAMPQYATDGSACFDLQAIEVAGGGDYMTSLCRTGLAFEVPVGHVMLIFSRSGQGFNHDTRLANCVGVIDSDYRGEVMVKLTRDAPWPGGEQPNLLARAGDRVAQAMLVPIPRVELIEVSDLSETARGAGGYGSTGA